MSRVSRGNSYPFVVFALALPLLPTYAVADPALDAACGPPPGNIQFSHNFVNSVATAACDSGSRGGGGNIGVNVVDVVGVALGGNYQSDQQSCSSSQSNTSEATKFVETEFTNNRSNVLSLCTYGVCRTQFLAHTNSGGNTRLIDQLAMETVANVCETAINRSDLPGPVGASISAAPSAPQYVFKDTQGTATYYATLLSNDNGDVQVAIPAPQDYVSVIYPKHSFKLKAHGQQVLTFKLTKPEDTTDIVRRDVIFRLGSASLSSATFRFNLVASAGILENPATIPCGEINPNVMAEAYRDDRGSDRRSDPASLSQTHSFLAVPEGRNDGHGGGFSAQNGFPSNGGGAASATLATECTPVVKDEREDALTILKLQETLWAQNATNHDSCGSGFGPGGEAAVNPEWRTNLSLPGQPEKTRWTIDLTPSLTTQFKARSCSVSFDGAPVSAANGSFTTRAGAHLLSVSCVSNTGYPDHFPIMGDRGGCGSQATQFEEYDLTVHATRH